MLQILFSFLAGILTVAAPCILLPLPIVLGGSVGQNNKTRPLFLVLGFVVSFSVLALLINSLVNIFGFNPNISRIFAVILLLLFAIFMIWPGPFEIFMSRFNSLIGLASKAGQSVGQGNFGGFILGTIIGIIWAPCAGPILASILTLIALQQNFAEAGVLLLSYAIGAGLPMLLIAYGGQALTTKIKQVAKYSQNIQRVFGVLLIILAAAIYFQYDTIIQAKILTIFPSFGNSIEESLFKTFNNNNLEKGSPAPEFTGISNWLNSEPLTLEKIKGKVVLIDFWTYSCINCVRTLPYVTGWYEKYKDNGFVVIGVHSPEFTFEKDTENVKKAMSQYKINYPVAQDNDYGTWRAYSNHYWPAEYLIDQKGNIVYSHNGEGEYDVTEKNIRKLLGLKEDVGVNNGQDLSEVRSPEMYFGFDRIQNLSASQSPSSVPAEYKLPGSIKLNEFAIEGQWVFSPDKASLVKSPGKIKLNFSSGKLFMVAQSLDEPASLSVTVDGVKQKEVLINKSDLYTLFDSNNYQSHIIEIEIPESGFEVFTFTFG